MSDALLPDAFSRAIASITGERIMGPLSHSLCEALIHRIRCGIPFSPTDQQVIMELASLLNGRPDA